MAKKIIKNLYLGDMNSVVKDAQIVISCAEETFNEKKELNEAIYVDDVKFKNKIKDTYYYSFEDYPYPDSLNKNAIKDIFNMIDQNINKKVMYIHCIWGVNRSASIVFMYLVSRGYIKSNNYEDARSQFSNIYPKHSPNPGWKDFLKKYYPYNF
ncbi:hypothetical protein SCORR_v1c05250 [Spiroplasma corruscae]|uniref:Tyrosine specific protein phosphatases domain-containing protein n=1 Tax=Spiroplasma corruscae TaxID=216934 RepID=A0A222EP78_9MOLU|nr:dual specificity protein phosphatase family protein [Spiroplasma corruscae]ASP28297.1 hypothetical protein SCORR_v1c05250 [Spiroplasma corruscae]